MSRKEWLKGGVSKGLVGLGSIFGLSVSPWTMLILLVVVAVLGIFFWAFLHIYRLVTAFAGFIGGLVLAWLGSNMIPEEERGEHAFKLLLIPIVLAVLGYFLEYFNIWRVPLTFTLPLKAVMFASDVVISLDTLLLLIVCICLIIQLIISIRRK